MQTLVSVVPDSVVMQIFTVTGQTVIFLSSETAKQIGEQLTNAAVQAKSGLLVPTLRVGSSPA